MELVGKLKDVVSHSKSKEEAHTLIKDAGVLLNEDELDSVTGGIDLFGKPAKEGDKQVGNTCDNCLYGWSQCKAYSGSPVKCPQNQTKRIRPHEPACNSWKPRPF